MWLFVLLALPALALLFYKYMTSKFDHFRALGVPHQPPSFPYGSKSTKELMMRTAPSTDIMRSVYDQFAGEKIYGGFMFRAPYIGINDPEIIKAVMVKDFHNFVDRQFDESAFVNGTEIDQIWANQLLNLRGDSWKKVRAAFTPIFTSGKIKHMMETVRVVCGQLNELLGKHEKEERPFELREVFTRYTIGSIVACTFGVDAAAFAGSDSPIYKHALGMGQDRTATEMLKLFSVILVPGIIRLYKLLGISVSKEAETRFFFGLVNKSMAARKQQEKSTRSDLVDLMIRAIKEGRDSSSQSGSGDADDGMGQFEKDASLQYTDSAGRDRELDEITICATAMVILIAGFDTTSASLAFATYELTMNPDIQRRLQEEIDANGDPETIDYNSLQKMEYLDMVCLETLRKYPPAVILARACLSDYKLPGYNYVVPKGSTVYFNVAGIHHDEKYYPNPDAFKPERFSKEERAKRHP